MDFGNIWNGVKNWYGTALGDIVNYANDVFVRPFTGDYFTSENVSPSVSANSLANSGDSNPYVNSLSPSALAEMWYNSREAEKSRNWQKNMRDTQLSSAFQQARDNGVNPYVMFNGGSVSTPGSSSPSYSGYASANVSQRNALTYALAGIASSAIRVLGFMT